MTGLAAVALAIGATMAAIHGKQLLGAGMYLAAGIAVCGAFAAWLINL